MMDQAYSLLCQKYSWKSSYFKEEQQGEVRTAEAEAQGQEGEDQGRWRK